MVGQVQNRVFVCGGRILDVEFVAVGGQGKGHVYGQVPGIAFFSIFTYVVQREVLSFAVRRVLRRPDSLVKSLQPAMQRVRAVVDRHVVHLAVQRELTFGDAIRVTSDGGAEIRIGFLQVAVEIVESEDDIFYVPGEVGN